MMKDKEKNPVKNDKTKFYLLLIKYREIGLMLIIIILGAIVTLRNPLFLTGTKIMFIIEDSSPLIILAAGMMCVLLVGSIDISIAGIMALSAMVTGMMMKSHLTEITVGADTVKQSTPLIVIIVVGMAIGALCGLINGLLIAYGNVIAIVTTLGTQYIFYGITHVISFGQAIYKKDMSDDFTQFTRNSFLGINEKTWIMLIVILVVYVFVTYFRAGRHLYAVGSNREAAEMRGINAKRSILLAHIIMGILAGLAGLLFASHDTKVTQDLKNSYEMYVIAACVIGGVSVTGGSGKVTGVLLGALTIGVINNGLPMMKLVGNAEFWKKFIQGALILIAVISNVLIQREMKHQELERRNI